jgi:hypothetical protein
MQTAFSKQGMILVSLTNCTVFGVLQLACLQQRVSYTFRSAVRLARLIIFIYIALTIRMDC